MSRRGLLIVFSGPSGVGKGTILQPFLLDHPECSFSVSATTRPPREGEVDGRHYHFVDRARFEAMIAGGELLEHAEFSGNYYGTPRAPVEAQLDAGRHVFLEIELQGAMKVRESCPDALFVFVMPPSVEVLRERLAGRGTESPEIVERRMRAAREEMAQASLYDYVIVNHCVEESRKHLDAIVKAAPFAAKYMQDVIREIGAQAQPASQP